MICHEEDSCSRGQADEEGVTLNAVTCCTVTYQSNDEEDSCSRGKASEAEEVTLKAVTCCTVTALLSFVPAVAKIPGLQCIREESSPKHCCTHRQTAFLSVHDQQKIRQQLQCRLDILVMSFKNNKEALSCTGVHGQGNRSA